jgi:hypothetical protein
LALLGSIGKHGPDLGVTANVSLEGDVAAVWSP